ncbi:lanthionine synthetase LanC family protein [Chitinophaga deserti]|uniref:lanthionine synthetase LanC family protein n=1 Tax=Chitinophaga deserti TaxID=2164099 RepID=UPI000D6B2D12|nr:lanthionine synthetase LanC family protein [Chitinophaga deserti]
MPTVTVSILPDETVVPRKAEKIGGKRIGFYYIILKSLKESRKNDVVKCLYIKSFTRFGYCVIKEGSQGDSKDKNGRDIQDRLRWQRELHKQLGGAIRLPRLMGEFEENGNYYLVIEHMKGKPLYDIIRRSRSLRQDLLNGNEEGRKVMRYLREAVAILASLHGKHIVHRDATLNNFMVTASGKVAVIDMELSYSISEHFPEPPFALGTFGYMSPEQEAMALPTVKEDVFAAGAMILCAWSGVSPYKFTGMSYEWLESAVHFFVPDKHIASLILRCMHPMSDERPNAMELLAALDAYSKAPRQKQVIQRRNSWSPAAVHDLLASGISALGSPLLCDAEKGWFAEHMTQTPESANGIQKAWYASFNRGVSGTLFFVARAAGAGLDVSALTTPIDQALGMIRNKYVDRLDNSNNGLHFGSDGVAYALSETMSQGLLGAEEAMQAHWPDMLARVAESKHLIDGLAGQGIARLACSRHTDVPGAGIIAALLYELQEENGGWKSRSNKIRPYFTSGISGIIYFLLCYYQSAGDHQALNAAIRGLRYLTAPRQRRKIFSVAWKKESTGFSDHTWSEGRTGIALAYLKAWEVTNDAKYRSVAEELLNNQDESDVWRSLGLYNGVAGMGETYLEAARILKDEQYLVKARNMVEVLLISARPGSHGASWFVEKERHPVAGLMVGQSGVLHFMLRALYPGRFGFPGLT